MISTKQVDKMIVDTISQLESIKKACDGGEDYKSITEDSKIVCLELYEFMTKFQGQEEGFKDS